jgi:hypothetical protein
MMIHPVNVPKSVYDVALSIAASSDLKESLAPRRHRLILSPRRPVGTAAPRAYSQLVVSQRTADRFRIGHPEKTEDVNSVGGGCTVDASIIDRSSPAAQIGRPFCMARNYPTMRFIPIILAGVAECRPEEEEGQASCRARSYRPEYISEPRSYLLSEKKRK